MLIKLVILLFLLPIGSFASDACHSSAEVESINVSAEQVQAMRILAKEIHNSVSRPGTSSFYTMETLDKHLRSLSKIERYALARSLQEMGQLLFLERYFGLFESGGIPFTKAPMETVSPSFKLMDYPPLWIALHPIRYVKIRMNEAVASRTYESTRKKAEELFNERMSDPESLSYQVHQLEPKHEHIPDPKTEEERLSNKKYFDASKKVEEVYDSRRLSLEQNVDLFKNHISILQEQGIESNQFPEVFSLLSTYQIKYYRSGTEKVFKELVRYSYQEIPEAHPIDSGREKSLRGEDYGDVALNEIGNLLGAMVEAFQKMGSKYSIKLERYGFNEKERFELAELMIAKNPSLILKRIHGFNLAEELRLELALKLVGQVEIRTLKESLMFWELSDQNMNQINIAIANL